MMNQSWLHINDIGHETHFREKPKHVPTLAVSIEEGGFEELLTPIGFGGAIASSAPLSIAGQ